MSGSLPFSDDDTRYMRRALTLAAKGGAATAPNPNVGAVVIKDSIVIGEGYHARAGEAHAEVIALAAAGEGARGATLYVTLEPCNHFGRTPPCTEAVLHAGVARVVIASLDPNPAVCGGGATRLQEAGLIVHFGLCAEEERQLNARWYQSFQN